MEQTKGSDIWSAAGFYNDNILQATIAQHTSRNWARFRDLPSYYGTGVNSFPEGDLLLKNSYEHFNKLLSDKEYASRLANRWLSAHGWRDGIMIPQKLSSAFVQRFNFSPNIEAFLLIQRLIVGTYNNARNYINSVMDYGSWELARKETDNLMKHIISSVQKDMESEKRNEN